MHDGEYQRLCDTIARIESVAELAVFRAQLRFRYTTDPRLEQLEMRIDLRAQDLLAPGAPS